MVSLDTIKKNFKNFVYNVSKKKTKKLTQEDSLSFSRQARIFIKLIEEKGFISEAETLEKIRRKVVRDSFIEDRNVRDLNEILNVL